MGGNVRVGLEDSLYHRQGRMAATSMPSRCARSAPSSRNARSRSPRRPRRARCSASRAATGWRSDSMPTAPPDLQFRHRPAGAHDPRRARRASCSTRSTGTPIGKVNFVLRDSTRAHLAHVSTRITELDGGDQPQYRGRLCRGAGRTGRAHRRRRLPFTNEIRFDAAEEWLYVVETTGAAHHAPADRRRGGGSRAARSSAPPIPAASSTASPSTLTAICGART
jgi:hypothetical protein